MPVSEGHAKSARERVREAIQYLLMSRARAALLRQPAGTGGPIRSLLILPADIADATGSRGDEAMIQAVIDHVATVDPGITISIATAGGDIADSLKSQGVRAHPLWRQPWRLAEIWREASRHDAAIVIGADVMDGYYSSVSSLRLWMLAELFAHLKGPGHASIGGFSFNSSPRWPVRRHLARPISPNLVINVRDPVSHRRFAAISTAAARLVADFAFMLTPRAGPATAAAEAWIAGQKNAGRTLAGLNIHPMLSPTRDAATLDALVTSVAEAARRLIDDRHCSLLLIPHDYRGDTHGDVALLSRLAAAIDRPERVMLQADPVTAAQIKYLAGSLDMMFSGRMHLAIAALGMGRPVVGVTYQDKFDGLFLDHFGLPEQCLVKVADALRPGATWDAFAFLVSNHATLRTVVTERLAGVAGLSKLNLNGLAGAQA